LLWGNKALFCGNKAKFCKQRVVFGDKTLRSCAHLRRGLFSYTST
jgi:hypothetical protein